MRPDAYWVLRHQVAGVIDDIEADASAGGFESVGIEGVEETGYLRGVRDTQFHVARVLRRVTGLEDEDVFLAAVSHCGGCCCGGVIGG